MLKRLATAALLAAISPAIAAQHQGAFVPRLIQAVDEYMGAYQACLVRTIAAYPAGHQTPEQIASASISACEKTDKAVKAATKRVYGFPSASNFLDGTGARILAYSIRLAKARIASEPTAKGS